MKVLQATAAVTLSSHRQPLPPPWLPLPQPTQHLVLPQCSRPLQRGLQQPGHLQGLCLAIQAVGLHPGTRLHPPLLLDPTPASAGEGLL